MSNVASPRGSSPGALPLPAAGGEESCRPGPGWGLFAAVLLGCLLAYGLQLRLLLADPALGLSLGVPALSALLTVAVCRVAWVRWERSRAAREEEAARQAEQRAREQDAQRHQLERALGEAEQGLQLIKREVKGLALVRLDGQGRVLDWDEAAEQVYGYRREEVLGQSFNLFYTPEDRAVGQAEEDLKQVREAGAFEGRRWRMRKGGERVWVRTAIRPLPGGAGRLLLTHDLSGSREAQEALSRSRIQYRSLTEIAHDLVVTFSHEAKIVSLNTAFERITGFPRGDWVGKHLLDLVHGEDRPRAEDLLRDLQAGKTPPLTELRLRSASAPWVVVEFAATAQAAAGGRVMGCLGIARDVSERKRAEEALRKTEEQLRQAQKMEAVGRLAGGIAHDFNNLLTVIVGCSELLIQGGLDEKLRGLAEESQKAAERAAALTRQLLVFSRKQVLRPRVLDLNALVGNVEKLLRRLIGEDIELVIRQHPRDVPVKVDPGQMEQVVMNLAINARDAMPRGGRIVIETAEVEVGKPGEGRRAALLSVSDNGCGMDAEVKAHLFEPFFTTKEVGKGTGLGLAVVYSIAQQSGGHVEVASEVGRGTTFRVFLPLTEESAPAGAPAPAEAAPAPPAGRGQGTVLLVEDEEGVRSLARAILEDHGLEVLEASNGIEALSLCDRHRGPIDAVVTDVVMPILGGVKLVERLRPRYPTLKVLYMSGYNDSTLFRHGAAGGASYLVKPFSPAELQSRVGELLGGPAGRG